MPDLSSLLAEASPREDVVPVCLAGELSGQLQILQQELRELGSDWVPSSMGDVDPRLALAEQMADVREQMRQHTVQFRLRALGWRRFTSLIAAHPAPDGSKEPYDGATFLPALLDASIVEPTLSPGQVDELMDLLNAGQVQELFAVALAVNEEATPVPF